ncbi:MAG TPA: thioredoxin [Planctomycetaceae bacterium]|nr:thioredoxin [Planctomycetaceae bacterium]
MASIPHVSESDFQQVVLQSRVPVVVDFYATWCGPCKWIAPLLDELANRFAGRVKVVKVDVDEEFGLAERFGISGVPTLLFFKNGDVVDRVVGALPPDALHAQFAALAEPTPVIQPTRIA